MRGGVAYKFGTSERKGENDRNPGPGHYYLPVHFADVPRYVIKEQNEEFKWV